MRLRRIRRSRRKSKNYVLIFTLAVAFITVGYATFAQPLAYRLATILPDNFHYGIWPGDHHGDNHGDNHHGWWWPHRGGDSQEDTKWDVGFVNAEMTSSFGSASEIAPVDFSKLSANFHVSLETPGDSITYTFTIKNLGIIDAKVSDIKITGSSSDALIFNVDGIEVGDTLDVGKTKNLTVTTTFNSESTETPETTTENLQITIIYVQK